MLGSTIHLQYSKETGHSEKQGGREQRERGERERRDAVSVAILGRGANRALT